MAFDFWLCFESKPAIRLIQSEHFEWFINDGHFSKIPNDFSNHACVGGDQRPCFGMDHYFLVMEIAVFYC
jgi:hypothetical protein